MPKYFLPKKLKFGDEVRIVAPSFSLKLIPDSVFDLAKSRLEELGLKVTFGKNTDELDMFESSSVEARVEDFNEAFRDANVAGVIAAVGGYNANYILDYIDWKIIKDNPKFFCGMSDITILQNAILARTGLVTYSGPNFRNFGQEKYFEYTLEYFKKVAIDPQKRIEILPSSFWSDDKWIKNQDKRYLVKNVGWWNINTGNARGKIVGGNLCSLNLLQGTKYMPSIKDAILFIEEDSMSTVGEFSRNLQSLMHVRDFQQVRGMVFGRFQKKTKMTRKLLEGLISTNISLRNIPIIANVDFGHTDPKITFPVGGEVKIHSEINSSSIEI